MNTRVTTSEWLWVLFRFSPTTLRPLLLLSFPSQDERRHSSPFKSITSLVHFTDLLVGGLAGGGGGGRRRSFFEPSTDNMMCCCRPVFCLNSNERQAGQWLCALKRKL